MARKKAPQGLSVAGADSGKPQSAVETTVAQLIDQAKLTDFNDPAAVSKFRDSQRFHLEMGINSSSKEEQFLSQLARRNSLGELRPFVRWTIKNYPDLLLCRFAGDTPLHVAIRRSTKGQNNDEFIALVLRHAKNVPALLADQTNIGMNCLHLAIQNRSCFTEEFIERALGKPGRSRDNASEGDSRVFGARSAARGIFMLKCTGTEDGVDFKGMTPLHMAATEEDENENDDKVPSLMSMPLSSAKPQAIASKPRPVNPDGDRDRGRDRDLGERDVDRGRRRFDPELEGLAVPNRGLKRAPTLTMESTPTPTRDHCETQKEDLGLFDAAKPFRLLAIVKKLVAANDRVLVDCRDAKDNTPFQALFEALSDSSQSKDSPVAGPKDDYLAETKRPDIFKEDAVLTYLREYIVSHFDRREAMKALYKVGEERLLEFDLSGLQTSTIDTEFLEGLGKVLRFEGILKYVALPRLTVQGPDESMYANGTNGTRRVDEGPAKQYGSVGTGLWHMCKVFQWLKDHNVESIIKVSVVDDGEVPHSDEAIEQCLDGLGGVRIWNWYKVDLCCDVIAKAAPGVREVTLYSSGNNAVLVGWSSSAGLAKLKKLERVHVYVQEGFEKPERLKKHMASFQKEVQKHVPGIKCSWEPHSPDSSYDSVFVERDGQKAAKSQWMETMEEFAGFLTRARPNPQVKPIKIAIIDDGIDMSLDDFSGKIQVGDSFFQLGELFGRRGTYYVPTGRHGTLMAQLICKVCPMVKLYIAQLEVLPGQRGQRSFTAESATEAITWAMQQDVDIISMSWSISGTKPLDELEKALRDAASKQIVMFCASIDEGPSAEDTTYPSKGSSCIKIGASTAMGARLSWVSERNSQFLLPGEAPALTAPETGRWRQGGQQQQQQPPYMGSFGSSVSTALAAGLAGVLLYCDRLLASEMVSPDDGGAEPYSRDMGGLEKDGAAAKGGALQTAANSSRRLAGDDEPADAAEKAADKSTTTDYLRLTNKMAEAFEVLCFGSENNKFPRVHEMLPKKIKDLQWNPRSYPEETKRTKDDLAFFMKRVKKL